MRISRRVPKYFIDIFDFEKLNETLLGVSAEKEQETKRFRTRYDGAEEMA